MSRLRPALKFVVFLVFAAAPLAVHAADDPLGEPWPFGAGGAGFDGRDLQNLGLIGAKVDDAARPRPQKSARVSGRRSFQIDRTAGDDGADKLRVDILMEKGPGARAKLRADDVIVGVNGQPFAGNSLKLLAQALETAETGANGGAVVLQIERDGKPKDVSVKIPKVGPEMADPTTGKGRRKILDDALAWLAENQEGGGYPQTLSGLNGSVVKSSLAGLAWIGGGSDLKAGKYAKNVRAAAKFVAGNVDQTTSPMASSAGGPSWDQSNWAYACTAIFLGELNLRSPSPSVEKPLFACAQKLVERQEASGGWSHGGGGVNALDYLELNIVSALAISGLGLAQQSGFEVPKETIEKAHEYIRLSSDPRGGVGYSASPGQAGSGNIGRTAGCYLGFVALGRGKHPQVRKMREWIEERPGEVLGGHASIMIHTLLAGVASHAIGGEARKGFWDELRRDLTLARAPDGSLQPRQWFESVGMESNSDVSFGDAWTTAAWAVVLACEPDPKTETPGLPGWTGRDVKSGEFAETGK